MYSAPTAGSSGGMHLPSVELATGGQICKKILWHIFLKNKKKIKKNKKTPRETWKSAVSRGPGSRGRSESTCMYKSCIHMSPFMQPIAVSNQIAPAQSTKHASCACVGPSQPRPGCVVRDVNQSEGQARAGAVAQGTLSIFRKMDKISIFRPT